MYLTTQHKKNLSAEFIVLVLLKILVDHAFVDLISYPGQGTRHLPPGPKQNTGILVSGFTLL